MGLGSFFFLSPANFLGHSINSPLQIARIHFGPVGERIAFADGVELTECHRIHANGLRDTRDVRFETKVELGIAETTIGPTGGHVGINADGVDLDVGNAVGTGGREAHGVDNICAVFRRSTGIPVQGVLQRHDFAVLLYPHFDAGHDALSLGGVHKFLLARPVQLDGPPLHCNGENGPNNLHRDARLAAESTADIGGNDADVLMRQAKGLEGHGHHSALGVGGL